MYVRVEPVDGREIERLITALLNATGVVSRLIEAVQDDGVEGLDVISVVAARLDQAFGLITEHRDDEELAYVTGFLAEATMLAAEELGIADAFSEREDVAD
jgi:hypothetical protein